MKKLTLSFLMLACVTFTFGQAMSGDYYIPQGSNSQGFNTLYDAVVYLADNGLANNTNFIIAADLNETKSAGLVNTSNFTLTIKPDAAVLRTITFDLAQRTANSNVTQVKGAIAIGSKPSMLLADMVASQNIVIDGSFGTTSDRYLKITTTALSLASHNPVMIYDGSHAITVKNCIITHPGKTKADGNAENSQDGYVTMKTYTDRTGNKMPYDITIENNDIVGVPATDMTGISFDATHSSTGSRSALPGAKSTGVVIRNNKILARSVGIGIAHVDGLTVEGNEIRMVKTWAVNTTFGIGAGGTWWDRSADNANISGAIIVRSNKILELSLPSNGDAGKFSITGISNSGAGGNWEIYNNFVTGYNYTGTVADFNAIFTGIYAKAGGTKIYNNTILLNQLPGLLPAFKEDTSESINAYYCGISLSIWGTNYDIKNNIIISNENRAFNFLIRSSNSGANPSSFTSDNNILYLRAGNTKAAITRTYHTLADYQAGMVGKDVNSKSVNVNFADDAAGDLHIAGTSVQDSNLAVPKIASVDIDIDGAVRQGTTYAGADESILPFITTSVENPLEISVKIFRTNTGIRAEFEGEAVIELFNVNGMLLDKARAINDYSKTIESGIYILKVNNSAIKVVL